MVLVAQTMDFRLGNLYHCASCRGGYTGNLKGIGGMCTRAWCVVCQTARTSASQVAEGRAKGINARSAWSTRVRFTEQLTEFFIHLLRYPRSTSVKA